ncbi:transposase [Serinicoccus kebangsaanensis]|uniref:transposase n=1 Tax=Serinicoccus kebangsaanensis TaxID=2602069 RepID=UPI00192D9F5F
MRRVKRFDPTATSTGQDELFATWRHHAVFTDSSLSMLGAEASHRDHAIVEQVIADLKSGPLAHAPSGSFCTNGAWTVLAAIAFNLTRAAGVLASARHARARPATIRDQLIKIPARIANRARRLHLHLPTHWPWQDAWQGLHDAAYAAAEPRPLPLRGTTPRGRAGQTGEFPLPRTRTHLPDRFPTFRTTFTKPARRIEAQAPTTPSIVKSLPGSSQMRV